MNPTYHGDEDFDLDGDTLHDECGVFGMYFSDPTVQVAPYMYFALFALQHRGQESAGIAVNSNEGIECIKAKGLVGDIFNPENLSKLAGNIGIGHVRYASTETLSQENAQPFVSRFKLGSIAAAQNGSLTNAPVIRELLEDSGIAFTSNSDTEVIINLIAKNYKKGVERALTDTIQSIKGSYGLVVMTTTSLIGARDPNGIRPLCLGKVDNGWVLASESCAIDAVGGTFVRDVAPGEIVVIDENGVLSFNFGEKTRRASCAFEYIYFARPDSVIDGIDVYNARVRAGEILGRESAVVADIVLGVPDSGIAAAIGFGRATGTPFGLGIVKSKYIGRTFIAPSQDLREQAVSVKLNVIRSELEGRRVVVIDDSIVRGTTSRRLVTLLRSAGAKEVHFRVSSPSVRYPCYFGIDIARRSELIGSTAAVQEICEAIGADSLAFITVDGLMEALDGHGGFCMGCFTGEYPMQVPGENYAQLIHT